VAICASEGGIEQRYRYLLSGVIVFGFAFAVLAVGMNRDILLHDEGLIVTGASRILAGAIPHRDFYTIYGPGQFCILALAFKFFGPSVLVERIWDLAIKAGIACLAGSIALRMMRRAFVAMVTVVCILWLTYLGTFGFPVWPALLLSLLSVEILLPVFEGRHSTGSILAAGSCVGMIALFRYDVGFVVCMAESTILLAFGVFSKARGQTRASRVGNLLVPFWLGIAIIFVPLMAGYAVTGTIPDFMFQVIEFPSKQYARVRSLPFPGLPLGVGKPDLVDYIVYLPPLVSFAAIATSLTCDGNTRELGTTTQRDAWRWKLAVLATLTGVLYLKGLVRVSPIHMALSIVPAIITIGAVTERAFKERTLWVRRMLITTLVATFSFAAIPSDIAATRVARQIMSNLHAIINREIFVQREPEILSGSCWPSVDLERVPCLKLPPSMVQAIRFVRSRTAPSEPIFVGVGRHDKIFIGNVAFYFIADRPPATKWYNLEPGLQTSRPIQDQMIVDLKKSVPRYVVIDTEWDSTKEPNESAVSSGVTALDEFIADTYFVVAQFPPYRVLERRND
jgi:hypothetical protein